VFLSENPLQGNLRPLSDEQDVAHTPILPQLAFIFKSVLAAAATWNLRGCTLTLK
jgi:hypothetical protein